MQVRTNHHVFLRCPSECHDHARRCAGNLVQLFCPLGMCLARVLKQCCRCFFVLVTLILCVFGHCRHVHLTFVNFKSIWFMTVHSVTSSHSCLEFSQIPGSSSHDLSVLFVDPSVSPCIVLDMFTLCIGLCSKSTFHMLLRRLVVSRNREHSFLFLSGFVCVCYRFLHVAAAASSHQSQSKVETCARVVLACSCPSASCVGVLGGAEPLTRRLRRSSM